MRKLWLLLPLLLGGCAFFFTTAIVHTVPLHTQLPDSLMTAPEAHSRALAYRFVNNAEPTMTVLAPSGHYYEYNFATALDSLCAQLVHHKYPAADAIDTLTVELLTASHELDPLSHNLPDFRYKAGFIVQMRLHGVHGEFTKSIALHSETAAHRRADALPALQAMLNDLLLRFVVDIDATLCEQITPAQP